MTTFMHPTDIFFEYFAEFKQKNQKLFRQIYVDIKRSLFRIEKFVNHEFTQILQIVFGKYFCDAFMMLDVKMQNEYYQGLTDVFELVFLSFVKFEFAFENQDWFNVNDSQQDFFEGDV